MSDDLRWVTAPDGTRLAVNVKGSGPPLLCVPGGPGRASAYLESLGDLDQSFELLQLDMRGTGRSELPADRGSLEFPRLADDVAHVIGSLELAPASVLAHSAGCLVSMVLAAQRPELFRSLILVTPSARGFPGVSDDIAGIRASRSEEPWYDEVRAIEQEQELLPANRRPRLDRGLRPYFYGSWDARAQAHAASTDRQMSMHAAAGFVPEVLPDPAPMIDALRNCRVRTLIVVGGLDGITGVRAGYVIADTMPDAQVFELPDAGHYPWIDEPVTFAAAIKRFVDSQ